MEIVRFHFSAIDSTNTWAKKNTHLFDPKKITLVIADQQYSGKGRYSRRWESPPKQNIYASFCFFVPIAQPNLVNIPQIMAISASEAMESLGFHPKLKWPNDLILSEKKVGGILCEMEQVRNHFCVIVGIGININMPQEQLQAINQPATSLLVEGKKTVGIEEVLQHLEVNFEENLKTFLEKGFEPFLSDFKSRLIHSPNQPLRFHYNNVLWEGVFHSINDDGSLNLELESGEIKRFVSGEIT
ncbi:MAG: Bifunctional ligase/repressor BirA [Chlamydiae bacterium]|nr:Bifunctional ligase/repressor BirA [Chlamydiota bacterium]